MRDFCDMRNLMLIVYEWINIFLGTEKKVSYDFRKSKRPKVFGIGKRALNSRKLELYIP